MAKSNARRKTETTARGPSRTDTILSLMKKPGGATRDQMRSALKSKFGEANDRTINAALYNLLPKRKVKIKRNDETGKYTATGG